jgi:hypothetical protein
VPGQQLLVPLTDLLGGHWMTSQSELERQSLPALDAFIDPPDSLHGFEAAALVEDQSVGPVPAGADDERLEPLVERFNKFCPRKRPAGPNTRRAGGPSTASCQRT